MKKALIIISILILVCQIGVDAQTAKPRKSMKFYSGNELLSMCRLAVRLLDGESLSTVEKIDAEHCGGFVAGVTETYNNYGPSQSQFCAPDDMELQQAIRVVDKWLRNHPEKLQFNAGGLVIHAMKDAYPCGK